MRNRSVMDRRAFLTALGLGAVGMSCARGRRSVSEVSRPNFVFFITDDIGWNDLGCYGHPTVKTPNLDRMASEGLVFTNAFLTTSSCSPSRCSIVTGRYPHNTGAPELHTQLPLDQVTFPEVLREAGYYTALSGKNHMGDVTRAFDLISKGEGPGKEEDWVNILQERPKDNPFFCWFASNDAHRAWQFSDEAPRYEADDAVVPPFLYDGPTTRQDLADYYHEISRTDYYTGKIREELERQGVAENTYFVYISDNGRPFPRCKTRLYDSGIKTPMIVWAPGRVEAARVDGLVSTIDLAPTFLELAGLTPPESVQGVSMRPLLEDPDATTRDYVFAEHNWHVFQAHERIVRWRNWLYIRNAWPDRQNLCVESTPHFPAGQELWRAEADGKLKPEQRDVFLKPRSPEELYDVEEDPYQVTNLAGVAEHEEALVQLRGVMDMWKKETGDTVPADPTNDREDIERNKYPDHKRGTFPGAERDAAHMNHRGPVRAEAGR